jgi:hypothetical protein
MTATVVPTSRPTSRPTDGPTDTPTDTTTRPSLWRGGLTAGAVAAVATTAIAGLATAAGVDFEISGEAIPLAGFAQMTILATGVGIQLATGLRRRSVRPGPRFVQVTVGLVALSLIPDLTARTDTGSKLVLMLTHLAAAGVVIPAIAKRLR